MMKSAGSATKTTRPAYGFRLNIPASAAMVRAMNATAVTVAITAPTAVRGCRKSALFVTAGYFRLAR